MNKQPIGQVLEQMGTLSPHDVNEILSEQRSSHQRFGTIAVAMGFCQPEHIWAAWSNQGGHDIDLVDLDDMGIDTQAVDCVGGELARGMHLLPIRIWEGKLVVAVSNIAQVGAVHELTRGLGLGVKCVLADHQQIRIALDAYYPVISN